MAENIPTPVYLLVAITIPVDEIRSKEKKQLKNKYTNQKAKYKIVYDSCTEFGKFRKHLIFKIGKDQKFFCKERQGLRKVVLNSIGAD